jgi:hypothetical protein
MIRNRDDDHDNQPAPSVNKRGRGTKNPAAGRNLLMEIINRCML